MGIETHDGFSSFVAGGALGEGIRVKLSAGKLAAAGVSDGLIEIGTMYEPAFADGDVKTVRLKNAPGVRKMVSGAAVSAAGVAAYAAASGKVASAVTSAYVGVFLEAVGGADQFVSVMSIGCPII
jgi:hypothetical protein